jgi:UTP--glucose-1-phosphate uridylyltransferase
MPPKGTIVKVRTAVIPVAGFGTRMLPASRSVPKPMLPVLDTPVVHLAVLEAVEAGIEHVIFVVSKGQDAVRAYFEHLPDLERAIEAKGNTKLLERMLAIPKLAQFSYVEQKRQIGLGDAILSAADATSDEPFAVLLPDDVIWSEVATIGAMIALFAERGRPVIAVREVPDDRVSSLGIVDATEVADRVYTISGMVEKPPLDEAPSNLAIIGRYVLGADIFEALQQTRPGAGGEVQITDALASMILGGVYAYRFPGDHVDVGRPLGLLQASVTEALRRPKMASELQEWLRGLNR